MVTTQLTRGRDSFSSRTLFRRVVGSLTILAFVFGLMTTVAASEVTFEIVVPIDTVVRAPQGSVTVLDTTATPEDLVGETCRVTAQSENQSSVHPGNDLIVEGETQVVLEDVESEPGGVVTATDVMVLGEEIVISLLMGPDEVFSAGIEVQFDCPPEETTTTTSEPTTSTTTIATTTTTTVVTNSTTEPTTTTTSIGATTTVPTTTTTEADTTTTIEDEVLVTEVLPHTGTEEDRLGLMALALAALGVMLLVGERTITTSPFAALSTLRGRCERCSRDAILMTPHGNLCVAHTRRALNEDTELWVPVRVDRRHTRP